MSDDNTPLVASKPPFYKTAFSTVRPLLNRNTLLVILALLSTFGVIAPEKATQLRNAVTLLPASTGDLVN